MSCLAPRIALLLGALLAAIPSASRAAPLDDLRNWLDTPPASRPPLSRQAFASEPLGKEDARQARDWILKDREDSLKTAWSAEWQGGQFRAGTKVMKFQYRTFGTAPAGGRSLYISLHGGGASTTPALNDEQWQNQIVLYRPAEGIYLAPRAPTDTWDLWHQSHIDSLFDRIIQAARIYLGVDRNKVYVMGYSAGGDGVYQLAPRMADRWAAAAMMAGHPNDASPLSLRNIGFSIQVGAQDAAYERNTVGRQWNLKLDSLATQDPGGYVHHAAFPNTGHWMNQLDTVAVPWMARFTRNPVPKTVVWKQDDVLHGRLYWLSAPAGKARAGALVAARVEGQEIRVTEATGAGPVTVDLNDDMLDLDANITLTWLGTRVFQGRVNRTVLNLWETLRERGDAGLAFSARIPLENGRPTAVGPGPRMSRHAQETRPQRVMLGAGWPLDDVLPSSDFLGRRVTAGRATGPGLATGIYCVRCR